MSGPSYEASAIDYAFDDLQTQINHSLAHFHAQVHKLDRDKLDSENLVKTIPFDDIKCMHDCLYHDDVAGDDVWRSMKRVYDWLCTINPASMRSWAECDEDEQASPAFRRREALEAQSGSLKELKE
jgi:hypothetical protein